MLEGVGQVRVLPLGLGALGAGGGVVLGDDVGPLRQQSPAFGLLAEVKAGWGIGQQFGFDSIELFLPAVKLFVSLDAVLAAVGDFALLHRAAGGRGNPAVGQDAYGAGGDDGYHANNG